MVHKNGPDACPDLEAFKAEMRQQFEKLLESCCNGTSERKKFHEVEAELQPRVFAMGRSLIRLFLLSRHRRLMLNLHYNDNKFRLDEDYAERKLQTVFGEVGYGRVYLRRRKGGSGYHPLDERLGLTRDGYSPGTLAFRDGWPHA
jgi:hypothetical protein